MTTFQDKVKALRAHHEELLSRKNEPVEWGNGIYEKYKNPILTAEHTPLEWRYDFDEKSNPYLMQRIMMNATLNSGAIKWNGKYLLVVRVEGADRKSFFAVRKPDTWKANSLLHDIVYCRCSGCRIIRFKIYYLDRLYRSSA